jgi:hypothetical protein
MSQPSTGSRGRRAASSVGWIFASVAVTVFVVLPLLGIVLLWAWGRWGSE